MTRNVLFSILAVLVACSDGGPRALEIGKDSCVSCRMVLADHRYGGEIVTKKGKVLPFDSAECLVHYLSHSAEEGATVWVSDFTTGTLVEARDATFAHGGTLESPMGGHLVAFKHSGDAEEFARNHDAKVSGWSEVIGTSKTFSEKPDV